MYLKEQDFTTQYVPSLISQLLGCMNDLSFPFPVEELTVLDLEISKTVILTAGNFLFAV